MKLMFPAFILIAIIMLMNSMCKDHIINNHCNELTVKEYEGVYFPIIGALFIFCKLVAQNRI